MITALRELRPYVYTYVQRRHVAHNHSHSDPTITSTALFTGTADCPRNNSLHRQININESIRSTHSPQVGMTFLLRVGGPSMAPRQSLSSHAPQGLTCLVQGGSAGPTCFEPSAEGQRADGCYAARHSVVWAQSVTLRHTIICSLKHI
jgi:hypothetical protein